MYEGRLVAHPSVAERLLCQLPGLVTNEGSLAYHVCGQKTAVICCHQPMLRFVHVGFFVITRYGKRHGGRRYL